MPKTYDDLSFKKLENGNYEIGIHTKDVLHY
jgi:exoribonuclease R